MVLTLEEGMYILYGSAFLGGGGGGAFSAGQEILHDITRYSISLVTLDEILESASDDDLIVTISPVGSPAAKESFCTEEDYRRIIELVQEKQKTNPELPQGNIVGLIPCEIGADSSFGPIRAAGLTGLPVVDAPCDGRAHPLGIMGSLGLEKLGTPVLQVASGGNPDTNHHVEISVIAAVESAADLIRTSASAAGGLVQVARNPVTKMWLKDTCAKGAYALAREIGYAWLTQAHLPADRLQKVCDVINGEIIASGVVGPVTLKTENALDYGSFTVTADDGPQYSIVFCNEYMAMDGPDGRKYTFPDLIVTAGENGMPIPSSDIKEGTRVYLLGSNRSNMILGKGLRYRAAYERLEKALGIEMLKYISDIIED